ncbi:sodium/calcium exchanger 3-like [Pecten maximus]|uniref:sodium/calcium exchanger 3-like n=1 Tax=Pecten maximus TaxID=6579 RepID=UPI0014581724|nr:sodium/calcium exchanger 3-like [Pecten maximus]
MFDQLPTASLCFTAVTALLLIGASQPSTFQLLRPQYIVDEDDGFVKIQVNRIAGIFGAYDVIWKATDITATVSKDYKENSGTVKFANLQTTAFISIQIFDDPIDEPDETFKVKLTEVTNDGKLGNIIETVVTIRDNDLPCQGLCKRNSYCNKATQKCLCNRGFVLFNGKCEKPCFGKCCVNALCNVKQFKCYCKPGFYGNPLIACDRPSEFALEQSSFSVKEGDGTVEIKVLRTVSSQGAVKVTWVAKDGSAKHGTDFVNHGGDLFFANGEKEKVITIHISNDQLYEKTETFSVELTSVKNPNKLVNPKVAVVTIEDDDKPCHGLCVSSARCDTTKHVCVCNDGLLGNPYKECHRPCYGKCLPNARCDESVNACKCNRGLVGDGVKKCAPPCDGRCKSIPHSQCNLKTNRCVCDDTYHGDPYTTGCKCGTSHY